MDREPGEIFAERVGRWLNERNLKQVDLAKRLRMEPKAVSKVLSEKRLPRDLLRWADAMVVSVEWLLGRDVVAQDAIDAAEKSLRLLCLTAICIADYDELRTIRDAIPDDLLKAASDQDKKASSR